MPSVAAAANTAAGGGTGAVVPEPSGRTKVGDARNAWPVGAVSPAEDTAAAIVSARRTKS